MFKVKLSLYLDQKREKKEEKEMRKIQRKGVGRERASDVKDCKDMRECVHV